MSTTFQYTAKDALGKLLHGTLEAASQDDARQQLVQDGFQVMELEDNDVGDLFPRRIKRIDIINCTTQLALMVDTGINLADALLSIAQQEENPTLKALLLDLKSGVESGESFSDAVARHPKHFDRTYTSLIEASEETGQLSQMLERIAEYMQKELETRSRVRGALAYPAVMMAIAVAVTVFLLTYILPKFEPLFDARGTSLPKMTIVLMHMSRAILGYWYLWLLGIVALGTGLFFGKRTEPGRQALDWLKINGPIVGPVCRKVIVSRSIRTLATLLNSGVSMLDALRLSSQVCGNGYFEKMWQRAIDQVVNGSQVCEALSDEPLMPPTLVQMISSGEQTGKLDEVLVRLSSHYDREVEGAIKTATSLIEPLMITAMGVVVGAIAMGLLLPIFTLSRGG